MSLPHYPIHTSSDQTVNAPRPVEERITKVRLLIVSYTLSGGGAERFASTLINAIDRDRFDIHLCLVRNEIGYPLPSDLPVSSLDKLRPWHIPKAVLKLRALIRSFKPDVVLTNIAYTTQLVGLAVLGKRIPFRWVARVGNDPASSERGAERFLNRHLYARRVDKIICNSKGLATGFRDYYQIEKGRVGVIYNPADFGLIDKQAAEEWAEGPSSDIPVIISVGRLTRQKRYDVLLEAFAKVTKVLSANLFICGEGPERQALESLISLHGLQDNVHLLGYQSNPYKFIARADLFVLSSDYEGLPNALIEAQVLGVPAVSTRCPYGPDEIIEPGVTGVLTAPEDPDSLAKAIWALLREPSVLDHYGQAAKQRARVMFDRERIRTEWELLLGGM